MNDDAVAKIAMMQGSLRCFIYGLISFLPGIGVPFAVVTLWNSGRARAREKRYWNPAKPYRIWGVVCAVVGGSFWGGLFAIIMINAFIRG